MESNLPIISKEFLEEVLKRGVRSFELRPGTNIGDNYMSVLYSIDVTFTNGETIHILSKCYPHHPTRQIFLNTRNVFWNELSIYQILIPNLEKLVSNQGLSEKLPFPTLIGGKATNFEKIYENGDPNYYTKQFAPFDNYIMMTDLRKTLGFKMADRQMGLNVDHLRLVIKAYAKLHSLSWAYKKLHGLKSLSTKYPFLVLQLDNNKNGWMNMMKRNVDMAAGAIEGALDENSEIVKATKSIISHVSIFFDIVFKAVIPDQKLSEFHRVQPNESIDEVPWRVLLHGDCWANNLMFRYDEETKTPLEVILVDLQMMKEHCPTLDLVYLIYTSTSTDLRKEHLNDILDLYHKEFTRNCKTLGVEPLPNFSLTEMRRRFHRAKILGYAFAMMILPFRLKDASEVFDLETAKGRKFEEVFENMFVNNSDLYSKQIVMIAEELHREGIFNVILHKL